MLTNLLFFLFAGATLTVLLWSGFELFRHAGGPAGRPAGGIAVAGPGGGRSARRAARPAAAAWTAFLYVVSVVPGGDDWMHGTERLLAPGRHPAQAGAGGLRDSARCCSCCLLAAGMIWLQRNNPATSLHRRPAGGLVFWGSCCRKMVLQRLVKRYRRKLQEALPDTVDLLGIVLGTGLALDQAMMRVSEEMEYIYPELAGEFATVVMQVRAGQERTTAFQQFVRRTGIEDIKSLAAMIVQSEKFGTSLAQALKVYADALRTRRRLRAEAAVGKAGIKMLFPIVIFILPVLFVITLVPGMLSVLKDLKMLGGPR